MSKKLFLILFLSLTLAPAAALAANSIGAAELKELLNKQAPLILVDIQPQADFEKQHLPGSIETNAFPAKSAEEKSRLDKALPTIRSSSDPVVVICPRGRSGAKNSYDYFISRGIAEERLRILEGGIDGWPYKELVVQGR